LPLIVHAVRSNTGVHLIRASSLVWVGRQEGMEQHEKSYLPEPEPAHPSPVETHEQLPLPESVHVILQFPPDT
jgi:hypothetical protein